MCLQDFDMPIHEFSSPFLTCREESVLAYIQPSELHEKMQDPSFLEESQLIDVREPDEVYVHNFPSCYV